MTRSVTNILESLERYQINLEELSLVIDGGRRRRKNACDADNEALKESGSTPMASSDSGVESAAEVDLTEMKNYVERLECSYIFIRLGYAMRITSGQNCGGF
ncbi:unnamed protein product [Nippostrongylus brasiliensis]|uniref:Uncharacterized protein n=1 Tax=Nippostrongylus brasiliensis TaxID=27835 RepID=A0A0N4YN61_NIPBR|nr:unnamed protein product [Nippostrongylus brasiliensis]